MQQEESSTIGKKNEWEEWEDELREIFVPTLAKERSSVYSSMEFSVSSDPRIQKSGSFFKNIKYALSPRESSIPKLIEVLDSTENCPKLAKVAEELGMGAYIKYYKGQKEIEELAGSVNGLVQLQMVKKKIRDLAKDFLYNESESKLNVPPVLLGGISDAVQSCGQNTVGNKVDVAFLQPITEEVLDQLLHKVMPIYKRREREYTKKLSGSQTSVVSKPSNLVKSASILNEDKLESTTENLLHALHTPSETAIIVAILQKQLCMENYEYYKKQLEARNYALTATNAIQQQTLRKMIKDIGKEFVYLNSPSELNISAKIRSEFEENVKENNISISILEPVTKEVLAMLLQNTYPVYKRLKAPVKNK